MARSQHGRAARVLGWALGVAGLWAAAGSPAVAQSAAPSGVKIETYTGTRRTDVPPPGSSQRITTLAPADQPAAPSTVIRNEPRSTPPQSAELLAPPPAPRGLDRMVKPAFDLPPAPAALTPPGDPVPVAPRPVDRAVVKASASSPDLSTPLPDVVVPETAPKPALKPDDAPAVKVEGVELSQNDLYRIALWQLVCTFCALGVGVVLLTGLALYVARRFGSRTGPLFCVEFINPPLGQVAYVPATAPPAAPPPSAAPPSTAQPFDIGPTYEEEMALRAEADRQAEAAVLQRIYDDNVKLRDEVQHVTEPEPGELPAMDLEAELAAAVAAAQSRQ
jgi:hypothetical protein